MTLVLVVAVLILLNGLFVAAEFAIVGASRAEVEQRARAGDRMAGLVHRVLRDAGKQDRYIATAQLGITSASLGLGMYGEHHLAEWLGAQLHGVGTPEWLGVHAIASVLSIALLTYLHVVLGEMVPKAVALQSPARAATLIALPMRVLELALYPLVVVLNGIGNGVLRLVGIERTAGGEERTRTANEISFIVAESRAGGLLAHEPARVIQELLEFGDLTAGEVMVPRTRMTALPIGVDRVMLQKVIAESRHTRYPVHEGDLDRIVGVVHVKDLLDGLPDDRLSRQIVRQVPFVPATEPLDRVLLAMRRTRSHLAIVMDEHGGTAGLVTLEDLFEEVVGELGEPGNSGTVRRDASGGVRVSGTTRLEELGEALGIELEHGEVDTVSGLVLASVGRPPVVGDRVEHGGLSFEVTAVQGRGVREARVVGPPTRVEGEDVAAAD